MVCHNLASAPSHPPSNRAADIYSLPPSAFVRSNIQMMLCYVRIGLRRHYVQARLPAPGRGRVLVHG